MALLEILVVDDSLSARFTIQRALQKLGVKVSTAKSGREALAMLQTAKPDGILMDHVMPELDGLQTLARIRESTELAQLPVVICSSNDSAEYADEARSRGAAAVIHKPPEPQALARIVDELRSGRLGGAASRPPPQGVAPSPPEQPSAAPQPPPPARAPQPVQPQVPEPSLSSRPPAAPVQSAAPIGTHSAPVLDSQASEAPARANTQPAAIQGGAPAEANPALAKLEARLAKLENELAEQKRQLEQTTEDAAQKAAAKLAEKLIAVLREFGN